LKVAKRRTSVVEVELSQLKQQLASFAASPKQNLTGAQTADAAPPLPTKDKKGGERQAEALPPKDPLHDYMMRPPPSRGARHAGLVNFLVNFC
jgi:hypothetical protein